MRGRGIIIIILLKTVERNLCKWLPLGPMHNGHPSGCYTEVTINTGSTVPLIISYLSINIACICSIMHFINSLIKYNTILLLLLLIQHDTVLYLSILSY